MGWSWGSSNVTIQKSDGFFSYRLSIMSITVSLTIQPQFAVEFSSTLKSTRVGHFGTAFGEEEVDRCKPNFNTIWEEIGLSCRYLLPFEHSA